MAHDSSFANRAVAVESISITEDTLPFIVEHICVVKTQGSGMCSLHFTSQAKVAFDQSQEQQHTDILSSRFTKRCLTTYEATIKILCCNWMKCFEFDPLDLVCSLHPVVNERVCEKCVKAIILASDDDYDKFLIVLNVPEREAFR